MIAASDTIQMEGQLVARGGGGDEYDHYQWGGSGSGGAVRLVATHLLGNGGINVLGGSTWFNWTDGYYGQQGGTAGGSGRIRLDSSENSFSGSVAGSITRGFQPIIIPAANQAVSLAIKSIAGVAASTAPSGALANPDVIIPAQQTNPIPVLVNCTNIPLNTEISVVVQPANGSDVQAVGINNAGTTASSTATVSLNIPRGGGIIYAKAVTGIAGSASNNTSRNEKAASYAQTGLTADGERFAKVETKATLGGKQETTLITASGKRYPLPVN